MKDLQKDNWPFLGFFLELFSSVFWGHDYFIIRYIAHF